MNALASAGAPYGPDIALLVNHLAAFPLDGGGYHGALIGDPSLAAMNQQMLLGVPQHA